MFMRSLIYLFLALALPWPCVAGVAQVAPDFSVLAAGDKPRSVKGFRGQPVVVVMTDAPRNSAFQRQLRNIQAIYQQLAAKQVVLVAAMQNPGDGAVPSNIPLAIASNGAATATAFGMQRGFQIAIIGRDGNLDVQSGKVLTAERVRDIIQNSFEIQASSRKGNN